VTVFFAPSIGSFTLSAVMDTYYLLRIKEDGSYTLSPEHSLIQGVSQKSVINLTVVRGCLGKYFGIGNIGSQQLIKGLKTWVKLALCPCNKK